MTEWTPEQKCSTCGNGPFKVKRAWEGHQRSKGHPNYVGLQPKVTAVPYAEVAAVVDDESMATIAEPGKREPIMATAPFTPGAIRYNDPVGPRNYSVKGIRSIKMAYPRHDECQASDNGPGWWHRCEAKGHNPYFTPDHYGERTEDVEGPEQPDGSREILSRKTIKVRIPGSPNLKQVPYTGRHNGNDNDAMRKNRGEGLRLPEELGLSTRCQFWNCWEKLAVPTTDLTPSGGGFCSEDHRKAAGADRAGIMPEVLNQAKKERQWATL